MDFLKMLLFSVCLDVLIVAGTSLHSYAPHLPFPPPSPPPPPPPFGPLPHLKHPFCDPNVPPACAYNGTNFCLQDKEYPIYEIRGAVDADYVFIKKYADIPQQSADDLVDMVSREQEEYFQYNFYTGSSTGPFPYDLTHWGGPEGFICPAVVNYAMPRRVRNVEGHWRVIVNDIRYFTQTTRMETCLHPESSCRILPPCYRSHCTQKFAYHRLLSWDPCDPYKGLFIDIYRLPSACSCHIMPY